MKRILNFMLIVLLFFIGVVPIYSQQSVDTFTRAANYFFQNKFEMAEVLFQEVIKVGPENPLAYSYLGDIYLQKKQYDGALNLYLKAIELDPQIAENYFRVGQIYYIKKNPALALENFNKTLTIDSSLKFTYYQIGLTYLMLERNKEKTIENWETYISLAPEDPQYNSIKRVIELLKDPNFILPELSSNITIEEALLLGGDTLDTQSRSGENQKAEHESKKSKDTIEDIYNDDDL
ncbi:MAG: tetratricopeptide repeat protein [Leptospirales bacterium]|nr:tetratricopeptide repeat protein [Leptospirales bacterium]